MFGFNPDKLSVKCQLCLKRMQLVRNRKAMQIRAMQQEIAEMMRQGQQPKSRIRVEELIRLEWMDEAMSTLETYLVLLHTRAGMLKKAKEPPPDMREAINTIIFAASRLKFDLDEMPAIADILYTKFRTAFGQMYNTKEFIALVTQEHTAPDVQVNSLVIAGLSVNPASPAEKIDRLERIAAEHGAPFDREKTQEEMLPRRRMQSAQEQQYVYAAPPTLPPAFEPSFSLPAAPRTQNYVQQQQPPQQQAPQQQAPPRASGLPSLPPVDYLAPPPPPAHYEYVPPAYGAPPPQNTLPQQHPAAAAPARPAGLPRPSSNKNPWDPLPPIQQNQANDFGKKLGSAIYCIQKQPSVGTEIPTARRARTGEAPPARDSPARSSQGSGSFDLSEDFSIYQTYIPPPSGGPARDGRSPVGAAATATPMQFPPQQQQLLPPGAVRHQRLDTAYQGPPPPVEEEPEGADRLAAMLAKLRA